MAEEAEDLFGPIDVVVVEFPDGAPTASGFDGLLALVDSGHIRVLDVEFVRKRAGVVEPVDIGVIDQPSVASFAGASAGLLDADDLRVLRSARRRPPPPPRARTWARRSRSSSSSVSSAMPAS